MLPAGPSPWRRHRSGLNWHGGEFVGNGPQTFGNTLLLGVGLIGQLTLGLRKQLAGIHLDFVGHVPGLGLGGVHDSAGGVAYGASYSRSFLLGGVHLAGPVGAGSRNSVGSTDSRGSGRLSLNIGRVQVVSRERFGACMGTGVWRREASVLRRFALSHYRSLSTVGRLRTAAG